MNGLADGWTGRGTITAEQLLSVQPNGGLSGCCKCSPAVQPLLLLLLLLRARILLLLLRARILLLLLLPSALLCIPGYAAYTVPVDKTGNVGCCIQQVATSARPLPQMQQHAQHSTCPLYTTDAAQETSR